VCVDKNKNFFLTTTKLEIEMGEKSSKHGRPVDAGDIYGTYQLVDKSGCTCEDERTNN
jgi:hypothetical protein